MRALLANTGCKACSDACVAAEGALLVIYGLGFRVSGFRSEKTKFSSGPPL